METIFEYVTDDSLIHLFLSSFSDYEIQQITTETENGIVLECDGPRIAYMKQCDPEMLELIFDDVPEFIVFDTFAFHLTNEFELQNGPDGYAARYNKCMIAYANRKRDRLKIHNDNGPAVITAHDVTMSLTDNGILFTYGTGINMKWIKNGKAFREVGPTMWYVENEAVLLNNGETIIPQKCDFGIFWKHGKHTIKASTLVQICKNMGLKFNVLSPSQTIFPDPIDHIAFIKQVEKELEHV